VEVQHWILKFFGGNLNRMGKLELEIILIPCGEDNRQQNLATDRTTTHWRKLPWSRFSIVSEALKERRYQRQ
jgi:hypothetical protein